MSTPRHGDELQRIRQELIDACGPTGAGVPAAIERLSALTQPGGTVPPDDGIALSTTWGEVAIAFLADGLPYQTIAILSAGLDHIYNLQRTTGTRYHKGMFLHNLAAGYLAAGNLHAALWFHRLAYFEDVLSRDSENAPRPEAPATAMLRLHHGIPNAVLDVWLQRVGCAAQLNVSDPAQRSKLLYPEVSAIELALDRQLGPLPREARLDLPLNVNLLHELDDALDVGDNNARGRSLELLAVYLCLTLPGTTVSQRLVTAIDEIDVVVVQRDAAPSYFIEALGRTLLVECKNWRDSVGAPHINHFAAKVRLHGCRTGILFATSGVSGERTAGVGLRDGQLIIQGWFHQDGIQICVVNREDVRSLLTSGRSFADLILSKFDELRFVYGGTS